MEGSIWLFRGTYCFEALYGYCILRIYSVTQGFNVVLCCIMIKVAVEGCIVVFKGGERRGYWRAYSRSLFYDVGRHGVE